MRREIKVKFQCPGDKLGTEVLFKAPSVIGAEVVQFKCSACGSQLLARVKRGKDFLKTAQVSAQVRILKPSAELVAMLKEEQELQRAESAENPQ